MKELTGNWSLFQVNKVNERGETPLHVAAISGDLEKARLLLQQVRFNNYFVFVVTNHFILILEAPTPQNCQTPQTIECVCPFCGVGA